MDALNQAIADLKAFVEGLQPPADNSAAIAAATQAVVDIKGVLQSKFPSAT